MKQLKITQIAQKKFGWANTHIAADADETSVDVEPAVFPSDVFDIDIADSDVGGVNIFGFGDVVVGLCEERIGECIGILLESSRSSFVSSFDVLINSIFKLAKTLHICNIYCRTTSFHIYRNVLYEFETCVDSIRIIVFIDSRHINNRTYVAWRSYDIETKDKTVK